MSLDKFLLLISTTLGFFGTIFIAKGIFKLVPEIIAEQSTTYYGYNDLIIENLSRQKADFISGLIIITMAFLLQLTNLIFISPNIKIFDIYWIGVVTSLFTSFCILIISIIINYLYFKKCHFDTQKAMTVKMLMDDFRFDSIPSKKIKNIIEVADSLFDFKRYEGESNHQFLARYTKFLKIKLPDSLKIEE